MIEIVPMAYRIVNEVDDQNDDRAVYAAKDNIGSVKGGGGGSVAGTVGTGTVGGVGAGGRKMDEDEERDAVFFRLESLGYRVGQGLVERLVLVFFSGFPSVLGVLDCILGEGNLYYLRWEFQKHWHTITERRE